MDSFIAKDLQEIGGAALDAVKSHLILTGTGLITTAFTGVTRLFNRASGLPKIEENISNLDRVLATSGILQKKVAENTHINSILFADTDHAYIVLRDKQKPLIQVMNLTDPNHQCRFREVKGHLSDPAKMFEIAKDRSPRSSSKHCENDARRARKSWVYPRLSWVFSLFGAAVSEKSATAVSQGMLKNLNALAEDTRADQESETGETAILERWTKNGLVNLIVMPTSLDEQEFLRGDLNEQPAEAAARRTPLSANDNVPQTVQMLQAYHLHHEALKSQTPPPAPAAVRRNN